MKNTTKILALFMTISTTSSALATGSFRDVSENNKNRQAIEYLRDEGVIGGYEDGSFKPEGSLNRAELLKILVGGTGATPMISEYSGCFPDVQTQWFAPYVCYAKSEGWVDGYPDGTFRPANEVSKVEAIKMTVNANDLDLADKGGTQIFSDTETGQWYYPYLKTAHAKGLLEETGGNFEPSANMTRGGVSENIFRVMKMRKNGDTRYTIRAEKIYVPEPNAITVPVNRVIDGDTVDVEYDDKNVRLRIEGINTPETKHPEQGIQCFGKEASKRAETLLGGKDVILETEGKTGKYGRLIAYIRLMNGEDFGEKMIREGYAWHYDSISHDREGAYAEAELEAKENGAGLWAENTCDGKELSVDELSTNWICSKNTYNCDDFQTHAEAQEMFDYCFELTGDDVHKLDRDKDWMICESWND